FNEALSGRVLSPPSDAPIPCDYDRERETKAQTAFEQSKSSTWSIQSAFSNLPPDPEAEGKKTLEGIDANNNGIRDDVEIAIYNYAPREDQETIRQAMIESAKSIQAAITADTKDISLLQKITTARKRANECLTLKSFRSDEEESEVVYDAVRNTKERKAALKAFYKALDANGINSYSASRDPNPCDFDSGARNFYRY
ncbi:MAG: hypothetical protein LBI57_01805, partial [Helicobacteraceae bacterium]|nr:hypothetical protein [Helicobacteraceae bacterium]